MVAEAIKSDPSPVYELRSFRSREALGALVGRARKALAREFDRELAALGLNTVQALVIVLLAEGDAGTAADIGRQLSHDAGAMTRMLDRLERKGLIRRVRCGEDRRKVILELTAEGKAVYPKLVATYVDVLNRFMHGFSKADARQLETLLSRMLANA